MRKTLMASLIVALTACGGGGDSGGASTTTFAESTVAAPGAAQNTATADNGNGTGAAQTRTAFLTQTYQNGLAEIALANLAVQRADSARVRRLAQMLLDDHTRANTLLQQQAQTGNISLPTTATPQQTGVEQQLAGLNGAEFDRAYLNQVILLHDQDVAGLLRTPESGDAQTPVLVTQLLPLYKAHLAMAEELAASLDPNAYLAIAYRHGLQEISLSTLARERTANSAVLPFAQMLIDHHTMLNQVIQQVAQQRGVSLPQAPSAAETALRDSLAGLSGADFDKAYLSESVNVHVGDVSATTAQAANEADEDAQVSELAADALPRLTDHLRMSTELYESVMPSFPAIAFQSNVGEVLLAYRALSQGRSNEVRGFAQDMVSDHGTANAALITLAAQKGVRLPKVVPAEFFIAHRLLAELSGAAFDRAYMEANRKAHEKAVAVFTNRANNESDPDYRAYAAGNLPTLRTHLEETRRIIDALPQAGSNNGGATGQGGSGDNGTSGGTGGAGTTGTGATGTGATGSGTTGTGTTGTGSAAGTTGQS